MVVWFKFRSGRITASKMKSVCRTDWGCAHERAGRNRYEVKMKESHSNFSVCDVGLVINPKWRYRGATPDGKVSCTCCEKELLKLSALIVTKKALLIMLPKTKISSSRKILVVQFIWIIRMPTIFKSRHSYSLQI